MRLIAALFCLMASVPAQAARVCVDAGRGPFAETGGVGRTGRGPGEGGGIGGTGARLGVVGVITGFGSLCVNGLRLQYDSSARISENGRNTGAQALAVGQFVSVEAERVGDALLARDIGIIQLLEGPLVRRPRAIASR